MDALMHRRLGGLTDGHYVRVVAACLHLSDGVGMQYDTDHGFESSVHCTALRAPEKTAKCSVGSNVVF